MEYSRLFQQMDEYFFPKAEKKLQTVKKNLTKNEVELYSMDLILKGQTELLKGNKKGINLFQKGINLSKDKPVFWNAFAISLYEYGSIHDDDKALQFGSKCYKQSISLKADQFDVYLEWGSLLLELGFKRNEAHFFQRAKEKLQKAIKLSDLESKDKKAELFWLYGNAWLSIADSSGEAVDIRLALDAFKKSEILQKNPTHDFWIDKGSACLQMALLINDNSLFLKAIQTFEKAIECDPDSASAFSLLADSYTGLYINTMDEKHYNSANKAFSLSLKIDKNQSGLWLRWAQLIGESGKLNNDAKKLQLSIDKCIEASNYDESNMQVIAQWTESLSLLGILTNRLDLLLEAEEMIIQATEACPEDPDLWYAYGICLTSFGKYYEETEFYELAIEKLQTGVSLNRTNAEIWQALAYCHSQIAQATEDNGLFERAGKFYRRAIDLKPCCPSLNFEYALNLSMQGELELDQDLLDEALLQYEKTIQDQKDSLLQHPEWLFHYGTTLDLMGELTEEKSYYIRATEILLHILLINPDFPNVYYRLALTFSHLAELISDTNLIERALNYYHLAAKQDAENSNVYLDWGLCLIHLSNHVIDSEKANQCYAEAEQKLIRAGQLGSQHAYYHLACLYSLLGRYKESLAFMYKAYIHEVLPPIEELVTDDWLEGLRQTAEFDEFLLQLEANRQKEIP